MSEEIVDVAPATEEVAPIEGEVNPEIEGEIPAELEEALEVNEGDTPEEVEQKIELAKRMFKLKVDGQEVEKEFDLSNEEEIIKALQLAEMSNKRAQEAAELRKVNDQRETDLATLFEQMKSNPAAVLQKLGVDVKGLSQKVLNEELEYESLTEEEKKIRTLEKQLQEMQEKEKSDKEKADAEKKEAVRAQYRAEMDKDLNEAIQAEGLKQNPAVMNRMVGYMSSALKNGIKTSFKEIAPIVKSDLMADISDLLGDMPTEALEKLIKSDKIAELSNKAKKAALPKKVAKKVVPTASDIKDTANNKKIDQTGPRKRTVKSSDFWNSL